MSTGRRAAAWLATFGVIARIALRNLLASRVKTVIVGGIILFGAMLVVVGSSLVDSIDRSMRSSIMGSATAHLQVFDARSKDEMVVLGGFDFEGPDVRALETFETVKQRLLGLPNVAAVVPMGVSGAIVTSGNTIDLALAELRAALRPLAAGGTLSREQQEDVETRRDHIRQMVEVLAEDVANIRRLQDESAIADEQLADVARASTDEFWAGFDADPLPALEFLENRIAPLATDADMLFLRYIGTDPDAFARTFGRFRVVDGQAIPAGQRGFMFSKFVYEEQVKLKLARRLDKMHQALTEQSRTIAGDAELQRFVRENSTQVREILLQLDRRGMAAFRQKLQGFLDSRETDVGSLLAAFFKMDDANFGARYRFFYDQLAPQLELYRVRIGDVLTIKTLTRTGYVRSVNLRVYGTFTFEGLEKSAQAGVLNLMDMVSFRELYGFQTDAEAREIARLKDEAETRTITRENAEAALFGDAEAPDTRAAGTTGADADGIDIAAALAGLSGAEERARQVDARFDPAQMQRGTVLSAAVWLKDESRIQETAAAIAAATASDPVPLKAITWQEASGLLGQLVITMRIVLFSAVLIIFVVALVIINNALVMATLERVREIGTLRAVGAQKRFIVVMLVIESLVVGAMFGALGAGLGAGVVWLLNEVGIPAWNQIASFFFSGPRLRPTLATANLGVAFGIVFVVSALSSFYPAWLAMRVTPRQAMQSED